MSTLKKWYSLNIYPSTKKGAFCAVLLENTGYHLPCSFHAKNRCKNCTSFKKSHQVGIVFHDDPMEDAPIGELLAHSLNLMLDSGWHYDVESNRFIAD